MKNFSRREELPDLGNLLRRDGRNWIALFSSWITLKQDAGSGFENGQHGCDAPGYILPV